MKGHKHSSTGGLDDAVSDIKVTPVLRNAKNNIADEATELKKGGRAKRKRGGKMVDCEGKEAKMHAGRKPRKSGGGCESDPYTSARTGTEPKGRKVDLEMEH